MESMDEATPRRLAERFWELMNTNDWQAVGALLHDDYTMDWPLSGERIRGRANFAEINGHFPPGGPWRFEVQRLVADERGVASEVTVTAPAVRATAISFFELRDGRIWHVQEYWPDPSAAAAWRAQWVERIEEQSE